MSSDYGWLYTDSGKEARAFRYAINAFKENNGRLFGVEQNSFTKEIESQIIEQNFSKLKKDPPDFYFNSSKIGLEMFYISDANFEAKWFKNRLNELDRLYKFGITCQKVEFKGYEDIVRLPIYKANLERVIKKHFRDNGVAEPSLQHWNNGKDLEFSYKGFLIIDLGHLYVDRNTLIDCDCKCIPHMGNKINHLDRISSYQSIYMPWRDASAMEYFYKYDCDFVIWWQPRRYDEVMFHKPSINEIAVIDTRDKSKLGNSLDYQEFIRDCSYNEYRLIKYSKSDYANMVVICDRGVFDNKDSKVAKLDADDYNNITLF